MCIAYNDIYLKLYFLNWFSYFVWNPPISILNKSIKITNSWFNEWFFKNVFNERWSYISVVWDQVTYGLKKEVWMFWAAMALEFIKHDIRSTGGLWRVYMSIMTYFHSISFSYERIHLKFIIVWIYINRPIYLNG